MEGDLYVKVPLRYAIIVPVEGAKIACFNKKRRTG
jgi:hypothetical protein